MTWVDHKGYFGADRRQGARGVRLFERRRETAESPMPSLLTAMRQLRQRAFDAHGEGAAEFSVRVVGVADLARRQGEHQTADVLMRLAYVATLGLEMDVRPDILEMLDRAHEALRAPEL
jgi:hypothetical protein